MSQGALGGRGGGEGGGEVKPYPIQVEWQDSKSLHATETCTSSASGVHLAREDVFLIDFFFQDVRMNSRA